MKQLEKFVVSKKYKNILNLDKYNILYIPENPFVDERLSGHADLSVFSDEKGSIFTSKYLDLENSVKIDEDQTDIYPNDIQLNCCVVGDNIILNEKFVSRKIMGHLSGGEWNLIFVKQGYAKCATLVVDKNSIITSDNGIYEKALSNNIDALLIEPGFIRLEGFNYGFIGGCGTYTDDSVLLTGKLDKHPSFNRIADFILNKNKNIEYLSDNDIFDIGGIIKI